MSESSFYLENVLIDGFMIFDDMEKEIRELQFSSAAMAGILLTDVSENAYFVDVFFRDSEGNELLQDSRALAAILTVRDKDDRIFAKVYTTGSSRTGFKNVSTLLKYSQALWRELAKKLPEADS